MLKRRLKNVRDGKRINGDVAFWANGFWIRDGIGFGSDENIGWISGGDLGTNEVYGKQPKSNGTGNSKKSSGNSNKQKQYDILKGFEFSEDGYLGEIRSAEISLPLRKH